MDRARWTTRPLRWLTTAEAAASIGVSQWWVRQRIEDGLLRATAISTGRHKVYRIRSDHWAAFRARFTGDALDPRFD
jgi:excisionase family DNA binding protein